MACFEQSFPFETVESLISIDNDVVSNVVVSPSHETKGLVNLFFVGDLVMAEGLTRNDFDVVPPLAAFLSIVASKLASRDWSFLGEHISGTVNEYSASIFCLKRLSIAMLSVDLFSGHYSRSKVRYYPPLIQSVQGNLVPS